MNGLRPSGGWLYRRCENLLAAMLLAMFVAFILQISFRYLLNLPIGWTNELSVMLWIWIVAFGAAFVVREEEEIRFDLVLAIAGPRARRAMAAIASAALVVAYGAAFPASYDYVTFMKVEKSAYLGIRLDWLFSIYLVFMAAAIVRHLWLGWAALSAREQAPPDATKVQSGV